MVFKSWLKETYGRGGSKAVALTLGMSVRTVQSWSLLTRFPGLVPQQTLRTLPGLDLEQWQREFIAAKTKTKGIK